MTLEWVEPLWLLGLLTLPAYALLAFARGSRLAAVVPGADGLAEPSAPRSRWASHAPHLLRLLVLALVALALARPRSPAAAVEERSEGVPIVIALDVSSSMLAEDFRPRNRITVAKQAIAAFVAAREADPIGLVAFAAEAITVVPISSYDAVIISALRSLQVGLLEDGTAIGEGLAVAVNRLRRVPARSRVVVLMSDGESNRGEVDPVAAAEAAALHGVQVFTVGVASRGVARVPVAGPGGEVRYAELPVGFDESLLRQIATITGGQYFRATDATALRQVYARIDALVKTPVETRRRVQYTEWYPLLLLLAAAVLTVEWAMRGSRWGVLP